MSVVGACACCFVVWAGWRVRWGCVHWMCFFSPTCFFLSSSAEGGAYLIRFSFQSFWKLDIRLLYPGSAQAHTCTYIYIYIMKEKGYLKKKNKDDQHYNVVMECARTSLLGYEPCRVPEDTCHVSTSFLPFSATNRQTWPFVFNNKNNNEKVLV